MGAAFEEARNRSRYALCEALRTVAAVFQPEDPWWRALMAQQEGAYLLVRSRYAEADEALQTSVAAYDEALSRDPDDIEAYYNKGNALQAHGDLLASRSRYEEAELAYAQAVAAYDEALSRDPDDFNAHYNKALALFQWGESMRSYVQDEVTRGRWDAAQACAERVLALAPQLEQAEQLLALIREELGTLGAEPSQEG